MKKYLNILFDLPYETKTLEPDVQRMAQQYLALHRTYNSQRGSVGHFHVPLMDDLHIFARKGLHYR